MRVTTLFSMFGVSAWIQAYLFLLFWHLFSSFWLGLEVLTHLSEVTLVQVSNFWLFLWCHFLKKKRSHLEYVQFTHHLNTTWRLKLRHLNLSYLITFLQSLKKFFLKMSLVVYSWSNILEKKVATSSAGELSFIGLPTKIEKWHSRLASKKH